MFTNRWAVAALTPSQLPKMDDPTSWLIHSLPQTKAPYKCIAVVANPAFWRQLFEFLSIAASQNNFLGLKSGR